MTGAWFADGLAHLPPRQDNWQRLANKAGRALHEVGCDSAAALAPCRIISEDAAVTFTSTDLA